MNCSKLKLLLVQKGIRQVELARFLNIDRSTVNLWINQWKDPPDQIKQRIAKLLEVEVEEIFPTTVKS